MNSLYLKIYNYHVIRQSATVFELPDASGMILDLKDLFHLLNIKASWWNKRLCIKSLSTCEVLSNRRITVPIWSPAGWLCRWPEFQTVPAMTYSDILECYGRIYEFFRRRACQSFLDLVWISFYFSSRTYSKTNQSPTNSWSEKLSPLTSQMLHDSWDRIVKFQNAKKRVAQIVTSVFHFRSSRLLTPNLVPHIKLKSAYRDSGSIPAGVWPPNGVSTSSHTQSRRDAQIHLVVSLLNGVFKWNRISEAWQEIRHC